MAATTCKNASDYIAELRRVASSVDPNVIDAAASRMHAAWHRDKLVATLGNGGSASTASHFVADLVKTAAVAGQRRLRATCLSDNVALFTAIGNDIAYDDTFRYSLEALVRRGDVLVAISASGNSPNVVRACEWTRAEGIELIALTGFTGGRIGEMADLHINIPSSNYGIVEDLHLSIGHMVTQSLRNQVASGSDNQYSTTA